jgi:hypothetical protein
MSDLKERVAKAREDVDVARSTWPMSQQDGKGAKIVCDCPTKALNGSVLSCYGIDGGFCKAMQRALTTVVSDPSFQRFVMGTHTLNRKWLGNEPAKERFCERIETALLHRLRETDASGKQRCLGRCETWPDEEDPSVKRDCASLKKKRSRFVTCPHQRSVVRKIVQSGILDCVNSLFVPDVGLLTQNTSETNGSICHRNFRQKGTNLGALRNMLQEMMMECSRQELFLGRHDERWLWRERVCQITEERMGLVKGTLADEHAVGLWEKDLEFRLERSAKQNSEDAKKKRRQRNLKAAVAAEEDRYGVNDGDAGGEVGGDIDSEPEMVYGPGAFDKATAQCAAASSSSAAASGKGGSGATARGKGKGEAQRPKPCTQCLQFGHTAAKGTCVAQTLPSALKSKKPVRKTKKPKK